MSILHEKIYFVKGEFFLAACGGGLVVSIRQPGDFSPPDPPGTFVARQKYPKTCQNLRFWTP